VQLIPRAPQTDWSRRGPSVKRAQRLAGGPSSNRKGFERHFNTNNTPRVERYSSCFDKLYSSTVCFSATKLQMLEPLAFDEYCRFDTFAFFCYIKRASIYLPKESRSIKTEIFI
jgi:hypothetical protein